MSDSAIAEAKGRTKAELVLAGLTDPIRDYGDFILGHGFFKTRDEHRSDQIYPLPDVPHLRQLYVELFYAEQEGVPLILPKSRQMQITWGVCAYLLTRILVRKHQLAIAQSKREDDAASLVERCFFMYDRLPVWLRTIRPRIGGVKENRFKLEIPITDSKVWGIPQGADIIRSNTVSVLFMDELDYQPEARAALRAAQPSLMGGGLFIGVSSVVNGGMTGRLISGKW